MAYYHTVKIIRASGVVTKRFSDYDYEKAQFAPHGQVMDFVRRAIKMPKTLRVEVEETDTQLYGLPMADRTYPRAVVLKDGRAFEFYGRGANVAFQHRGSLNNFRVGS